MEKTSVVVLSVNNEDISVKISVAKEDYSAMYDLQLFKQEYDKDSKTWSNTEEATKRYEELVSELGGIPEEDDVIELYLNDSNGKAYVTPPKSGGRIEKPELSLKRLKQVPIVDIKDSAKGRAVVVEHKGKRYAFNFNTGEYIQKINKFIPNQGKLIKAQERFNELFEDVNVTWDNPELAIGLIVDCTVNKNALDPSSPYGWLECQPVDPADQPLHVGEDDMPF